MEVRLAAEVGLRPAFVYAEGMEVHLTPDQQALIHDAVESGRLTRADDAVREAMALWEERERSRAEILAAIALAEVSLALGKGRRITDTKALADDIKRRGRARLTAERNTLP